MSEFSNETGSGESVHDASGNADRYCIACGYNLRGLGEQPRCPECGLLHITDHFRQQVWDLVDSGKWFFSGLLTPFRKRLPGWWWALDREGDVSHSFRNVGKNILLAAIIIFSAAALCDAFVVEHTRTFSFLDGNGETVVSRWSRSEIGLLRSSYVNEEASNMTWSRPIQSILPPQSVVRINFAPSGAFVGPGTQMLLLACLMWLCPSCIGLWTQIRKGLPAFAKAPRTILAAANLESHRVVYNAVLSAIWMLFDLMLRWRAGTYDDTYETAFLASVSGFYLIAATGWVGPLRSDYTGQLGWSRWHALRIILMYAIFAPPIVLLTINLAV
ncbi:MAG: hypothetical protein IH987_03225, partial [Planctomycetes bacterium]|nr:hypothetical protein [Planctomycetota bacterium]